MIVAVLRSLSTTVLDLTSLLLLLTLAKTACANKVADSIAPFMKTFASRMPLTYLVAWLCSDPQEELRTRTESAFRYESSNVAQTSCSRAWKFNRFPNFGMRTAPKMRLASAGSARTCWESYSAPQDSLTVICGRGRRIIKTGERLGIWSDWKGIREGRMERREGRQRERDQKAREWKEREGRKRVGWEEDDFHLIVF